MLLVLVLTLSMPAMAEETSAASPWTVKLDEIMGVIPFQEGFLVAYTEHLEYCIPQDKAVKRIPLEKDERVQYMAYDAENQRALLYLVKANESINQSVWLTCENNRFTRKDYYSEENFLGTTQGIWANGSTVVTQKYAGSMDETWFEFRDGSIVTLPEFRYVIALGINEDDELVAVGVNETGESELISIRSSGEVIHRRSVGSWERDWVAYDAKSDMIMMLRNNELLRTHLIRSASDGSEEDCGWLLLGYASTGKRGFCANGEWVAAASMQEIVFQRFDSPFVLP